MRLAQILATLTQEPLILMPAAHASLLRLFEEHREGGKIAREGTDMCGDKADIAQAEMIDGIYHIPVNGPIGRGLGKFEKGAGAVDVADLSDEIVTAEEDPMCRGIIFHYDTPGGMYSGTPEIGNLIQRCDKMTAAYIPGMCCSGGYWQAASCDVICATVSADIANVGVYSYSLDRSAQYAAAGIKPVLVTSGDFKGMGAPGIPLNKAQLQHLQDRVDEMAQSFYAHVQSCRPDVQMEDMRGQAFKSQSALAKGFIDLIVPDLDAVTALFR